MKKNVLVLYVVLLTISVNAQQVYKTIIHDSITREYLEYVPQIYDGSKSVPLVICLHGLGDTIENFANIGMNYVADTANFIVLTPQALNSSYGTAWNSGASYYGYVLNSNVDDVGFISDLIDTTLALYNIDTNNIFVTGFSMGGFMSNRLACELNNRIRAIASVSGTIGASLNCNPAAPIPVCHFHGTADQTVAYSGNLYGNDAEELINYWVGVDNCDTIPVIDSLPDTANDGKNVIHYCYKNGENNTSVELYKVINGEHEWLFLPDNDISYTFKIWDFFRRNLYTNTSLVNTKKMNNDFIIYPNPAKDYINIKLKNNLSSSNIVICDIYGRTVKILKNTDNYIKVDISNLDKGIYIIKIVGKNNKLIIK